MKNNLPKTWDEYLAQANFEIGSTQYQMLRVINGCDVPDKYIALMKLELLRGCYREGWTPNWCGLERVYSVIYKGPDNPCCVDSYYTLRRFLTFQTKEIADEFVKNFYSLIKEATDLI